ncbi:MAG: DUF4179 domain-containing protein [Clostridia bacterium]|nr:DUF4179 domain-containing protein [Clostridia bacterium]
MKTKKNLAEELGIKHLEDTAIGALRVDTKKITDIVMYRLHAEPQERGIMMKRKRQRTILLAAVIGTLALTTVFASAAVREKIGEIISYFQSEEAVEISNTEQLAAWNHSVGKSVSKDGYTLSLDNVAADDNFVHVFYTLQGENALYNSSTGEPNVWVMCLLSGAAADVDNHNTYAGYQANEHTLKFAAKYNIAGLNLSDNFRLELIGVPYDEQQNNMQQMNHISDKVCAGEALTAEELAQVLYINTEIDKSAVKINTVKKELNVPLWGNETMLTKFIYSPFGSQLVTSTKSDSDPETTVGPEQFAVFDEQGSSLDILNNDFVLKSGGVSNNAYELLRVTPQTKQLQLVPFALTEHHENPEIAKNTVGNFPLELKVSEYGKVVVTGLSFRDGEIAVDYYKDGFTAADPSFIFYDGSGEPVELGGKLNCTKYVDVHYDTNSYTARYVYAPTENENAAMPPEFRAAALEQQLQQIGVFGENIKLDFDKKVVVNLG